ncbi:hypothetical protein [Streptomyces pseudogriseolus]|uniref:hypothetical protein n=1 Tax=Streptomyces pseudogriseolus TaxID=36817 RepID=UPI0036852128
MDWNSLTLTVLAVFGLLSLVVTLLVQLIKQLPELIGAVREMMSALKPEIEGGDLLAQGGEVECPARQEVSEESSHRRDQDEAA